jgi:serine/threonine-protein kinase RsbW
MAEATEHGGALTLPLLPDSEVEAVRAAGRLAGEIGLSADKVDEMAHAIVEACINAREHSGSRDGLVRIDIAKCGAGGAAIRIRVSDCGGGFDPAPASRRAAGRRGRGLAMIEALMDEISVESGPGGTNVLMVKYAGRSRS